MITVMVTGVGAIMGYGLLRSLRQFDSTIRLVGTDIYPDAVGQAWADVFEQAPYTSSSDYPIWLRDITKRNNVDLLIPGIEQDVQRLSTEPDVLRDLSCRVALNNPNLIRLTQDKWLMHQELLHSNDVSRIPSYIHGTYEELVAQIGLPFILKPRRSYASKGLVRINHPTDFAVHAASLGDTLMAQPIIGADDEEYTVGAFGDGQGGVACSITLNRRLAPDGSTSKAWVRHHTSLDEVVHRLCAYFQPLGPTNLQFRRDEAGWKLLEINPRISSTSSLRTAFGYNEAAMCLDFFLLGKLPSQPKVRSGFAVRYIQDYIVHDRDHF
jgi:carbamoyl-phosphate synthase large subunit